MPSIRVSDDTMAMLKVIQQSGDSWNETIIQLLETRSAYFKIVLERGTPSSMPPKEDDSRTSKHGTILTRMIKGVMLGEWLDDLFGVIGVSDLKIQIHQHDPILIELKGTPLITKDVKD